MSRYSRSPRPPKLIGGASPARTSEVSGASNSDPTPMPRTPQTVTSEATDGDTSSRSSRLRNPLVRPACSATAASVSPAA